MLIHKWMSKEVLSIESDRSLHDAITLFKTRFISMLPVFKSGCLVGIVTDGDIKRASPSDATSLDKFEIVTLLANTPIKTIMRKPVVTVREDFTVVEGARLMLKRGIGGLPVVDKYETVVGVLTKSDIFRCLVSFAGITEGGQIFGFSVKDKPGEIKQLTDLIRQQGGRLGSIMTSYNNTDHGLRTVFIHTFDLDTGAYACLCEEFKAMGQLIYCAYPSKNKREFHHL